MSTNKSKGKKVKSVHFMSQSDQWATPQDLFDDLNSAFNFTLDPCADASNAKCPRYFTEGQNGLLQSWEGERVFMNPPYGRGIGGWIEKAATGGGKRCCGPTSRAHRHEMVAKALSSSSHDIYSRPLEVRRIEKLRALSFGISNLSLA